MHVQWVAKYIIYTWNLPSFFDCFLTVDEHLENPTTLNLSRLVNFRNKAVSIYLLYLAFMIFNFIPANSAKWGEMLDVNIHETNKVVLALKRKKAKACTNAKKGNNTALWETRECKTYVFWTSKFKNCLPKFQVVYHPHIQHGKS